MNNLWTNAGDGCLLMSELVKSKSEISKIFVIDEKIRLFSKRLIRPVTPGGRLSLQCELVKPKSKISRFFVSNKKYKITNFEMTHSSAHAGERLSTHVWTG